MRDRHRKCNSGWRTFSSQRLIFAATLIVMAFLLVGCDRFYFLTIENYTDKQVHYLCTLTELE